ncbi:MAG: family 78 glycoside hydrolase catalytic domain [Lachnospiraceae bacterium]|nr:family 78 glycoside hydrolase catalytic domain [Lachnospiraceae bacterium]
MKITGLKTNHIDRPLGFAMEEARISYLMEESTGKRQKAARVLVALDPCFDTVVYDSGLVENEYDGEQQLISGINPAGSVLPVELLPRTRYYWKVFCCTDDGEEAWSDSTWFETAKGKDEAWAGCFIRADFEQNVHPVLSRRFLIGKEVKQARIYILGLGVYELYANGKKVGDEYLLPGLHSYDCWLQYQTFALDLKAGENCLEVMLGDGWYKGPYGLKSRLPRYGNEYALLAEVHIAYCDGTEEIIATDSQWTARKGNVTFDSIYNGENIDDYTPADETVYGVTEAEADMTLLQPRKSPYLKIQETRKPKLLCTPAKEQVLDFGQNMTGWVQFQNFLPAGAKIRLCYGEILQNGNFYRGNLRNARCEMEYVSDGHEKIIRPHFTFFGFRYVKVEGWDQPLDPSLFTGCAIYSEMEQTGWITTSDEKVNKLFENIVWGQRGNFLDVPTDCPQRDERMGWTGDAQVFADTACFNMNTYAFYRKFGQDVYLEQKKFDGSVPYVVPTSAYILNGATTWGDAATIIPWQTYVHFGDPKILEEQYDSMKIWVDYIGRKAEGKRLWKTGQHFGDWLALDGRVPGGVYGRTDFFYIATVFYYYSAQLLAKAAVILKREADASFYGTLAEEIRDAFWEEYFTPSGRLAVDTQTAYALAAYMELVPVRAKERFASDFRNKMQESGFALETGFAGTPYLLIALSKWGMDDVAYRLLLREEFPGWLYEVNMDATTVWERWNSVMPDGSMNPDGMNSLNHYAYGSVGAWMYRYMCGIQPMEDAPGFARVRMNPHPGRKLQHAKAAVDTSYGRYACGWSWQGEQLVIEVTVPFGGSADLMFPPNREGLSVIRIEAGSRQFVCTPVIASEPKYSLESDWRLLLQEPEARRVVEELFPRAVNGIAFQNEMTTMAEVTRSPFSELDPADAMKLDEALRALG